MLIADLQNTNNHSKPFGGKCNIYLKKAPSLVFIFLFSIPWRQPTMMDMFLHRGYLFDKVEAVTQFFCGTAMVDIFRGRDICLLSGSFFR